MQLKDRGAGHRVKVWISPMDNTLRAYWFANCGYVQMPATIAGHVGFQGGGMAFAVNTLLVWKPADQAVANCMPLGGSSIQSRAIVEKHACAQGYDRGFWTGSVIDCEDMGVATIKWTSSAAPPIAQSSAPISCKLCGTFSQYSVPNQKDGVSFVCYSCRR